MPRFLIIGAGPTGLGAALRLSERGERDFLVLEASGQAGGLAGSAIDDQGFTWDHGGHVQFSHYRAFDDYMDRAFPADGWLRHQRERPRGGRLLAMENRHADPRFRAAPCDCVSV